MARKQKTSLLDRLTVILLIATGLVCLLYAVLLVLPTPLARQPAATVAMLPTLAPRPTQPSPTPKPTETPSPTPTRPTNTPVVKVPWPTTPIHTPTYGPTNTPTVTRTPTPTFGPSPTPSLTRSRFPFTAELVWQVSPYGCNWAGIAGAVLDLEGKPVKGHIVHVYGDADIDTTILSGNSQFLAVPGFGESAWDVPINGSDMVAGVWRVQLFQPGTNRPISEEYEIRLERICGKSFAFVRFVQNH